MQASISNAVLKQGLGALFCAAVSFVLVVVLARHLGTGTFGQYVTVLNGVTVGLILLEGGWHHWLYRERAVAQGANWRVLMGHGVAHVVLATAAALALSAALAGRGSAPWVAAWACMGVVALMNLVSARMRGAGHFGLEALWQSAGRVASAVGILWVLWAVQVPSVASVFWAWAAGLGLVVVAGARAWLVLPRWRGLLAAYPQALAFVAMVLGMTWLLKGDMVLLGRLSLGDGRLLQADDLSLYAACTRLTEVGVVLYAPLGNVLLNGFSRPTNGRALLWRVMALVLAVGAGAVALAYAMGEAVMVGLFGAAYAPAGALLPWVLLMLPFALGNLVLVQWLMARRRERAVALWLAVAGAGMWWGVSVWTGWWGARGAAVAVAATHAALMGVLLCMSWLDTGPAVGPMEGEAA